jgi:tape measure domain-containing protein
MASKKDVELVLRARNEASKSIDSVTAALKSLDSISKDLNQTTSKTSGLMGELGTELNRFAKETASLKSLSDVNTRLRDAGDAINRLTESARRAKTEAAGFVQEYSKAATAVRELKARAAEASTAFESQEATTRSTAKALRDINLEVSRAEKAYGRLYDQVRKTKAPSDELKDSLRGQRDSLISLYAAQERVQAADNEARNALTGKRTALREVEAALAAAAKQQDSLRVKAEAATKAERAQRTELAAIRSSLAGVQSQAAATAKTLGSTSLSVEDLAKAQANAVRQAEALAAAQERLRNASSIKGAQNTLGGAAGATAQYREQSRIVAESRAAMKAATDESTRLGRAMATAAAPTRELANQFLIAKTNAAAATAEYAAQSNALNKLRGSAGGGFAAFAQAERQIIATANANARAAAQASSASGSWGRLSTAINLLNAKLRETVSASQRAAIATQNAADAQSAFVNPTRTALSLMQRLRGQVLGITAAYIGFFQAINQFQLVIDTMRTVEQAQAKLAVVFGNNTDAIASEMDFLRETSVRLGQEFGLLAQTYTSLAISAQGAGLQLGDTRDLFTSVAEASRVLGLSNDQVGRIFKAFEQILSKGTIQAEELRGQIGDSGLSGAYRIFADALGVTTAELGDMMKAGQVFADRETLGKVADRLREKFGSGLPAALRTTGAEMDRLSAIQTILREKFANGGFGDAFTNSLRELNTYLQSDEAERFFTALGNAAGIAVRAIVFLAENFEWLARVIELVAIVKFTRALLDATSAGGGLAKLLGVLGAAAMSTRAGFLAARAAGAGMFAALAAGARSLLAALGPAGWIALGLGLIIELTIGWFNSTGEVNDAMDRHEQIMQKVRNAYSDAAQGVDDWQKRLADLSEGEIVTNTRALTSKVQAELDKLEVPLNSTLGGIIQYAPQTEAFQRLQRLVQFYKQGAITGKQFFEILSDIEKAAPPEIPVSTFTSLRDSANAIEDARKAIEANELSLKARNGTLTDAEAAELGFAKAVDTTNEALSTEATAKYEEAVKQLKEQIPEMAEELERLGKIDAIDKLVASLEKIGLSPEQRADIERLAGLARDSVNVQAVGGGKFTSTVDLIKQFEGFRETPYWDVNAYRAGYGSDTVTLADGSIQKITQGMKVSQIDAMRDLVRRIGEFQEIIKGQIGSERFNALSPEQQGALTSIAYNYGSLPDRIVEAVRTGSAEQMAAAVRGLAGDNGGINASRRNQEADILAAGSAGLTSQILEEERKRTEEVQKYNEARAKSIADGQFELQQQQLLNTGLLEQERQVAINKAVREAENEAIKAGVAYTDEMRRADTERAAAAFDAANQTRVAAEAKQKVDEQVNILLERQKMLMEQIQFYEEQGNSGAADGLRTQLTETNAALETAIQKAQQFYSTLGGPEAENARLRLEGIRQSVSNVGTQATVSAKQINDTLISGLSSAFDNFARSVAEGANVFKSLRDAFLQFAADFLRQIAQMILQAALLNALGGGSGGSGGAGGFLSELINGIIKHDGGLVGSTGRSRAVSPAWFSNAVRYHQGGIAGLKPGEVPAILERGEEVLTANDPRHMANGGGQSPVNVKVVNTIDPGSFVSEGLNTPNGEQSVLNFIRSNQQAVRSALGV